MSTSRPPNFRGRPSTNTASTFSGRPLKTVWPTQSKRGAVDEFPLHLRDQRRVGLGGEHRVGEPHSGSGQGPYVALDEVVREDVHPVHEGGHPRLDGVEGGEAYEAVQGLGGEPAPLGVGTSCEPAEQVPVGTAPADHRLPEVGVGVDEPRHDQLARSVHDPGAGRGPQARADGGDGAVSHQDVGVLEGAEGAAAEGRVHGEHEGGAAQQDRRADRDVWAFGAGGDAEDERGGSGQAEAGEDAAAAGGRRRSGGRPHGVVPPESSERKARPGNAVGERRQGGRLHAAFPANGHSIDVCGKLFPFRPSAGARSGGSSPCPTARSSVSPTPHGRKTSSPASARTGPPSWTSPGEGGGRRAGSAHPTRRPPAHRQALRGQGRGRGPGAGGRGRAPPGRPHTEGRRRARRSAGFPGGRHLWRDTDNLLPR